MIVETIIEKSYSRGINDLIEKIFNGTCLKSIYFYITAKYWTNPLFIVNLKDVDKNDNENMATVIIALMQLDGRVNRMRSNNTLGINQECIHFKFIR